VTVEPDDNTERFDDLYDDVILADGKVLIGPSIFSDDELEALRNEAE
jgi:hypothetical protein